MRATVRRSVSAATLLRAALRRCTQTNPNERWKPDSAGCENQGARIPSSRNDSAWCEGRNERRSLSGAPEDRRMVSPDDLSCRQTGSRDRFLLRPHVGRESAERPPHHFHCPPQPQPLRLHLDELGTENHSNPASPGAPDRYSPRRQLRRGYVPVGNNALPLE